MSIFGMQRRHRLLSGRPMTFAHRAMTTFAARFERERGRENERERERMREGERVCVCVNMNCLAFHSFDRYSHRTLPRPSCSTTAPLPAHGRRCGEEKVLYACCSLLIILLVLALSFSCMHILSHSIFIVSFTPSFPNRGRCSAAALEADRQQARLLCLVNLAACSIKVRACA